MNRASGRGTWWIVAGIGMGVGVGSPRAAVIASRATKQRHSQNLEGRAGSPQHINSATSNMVPLCRPHCPSYSNPEERPLASTDERHQCEDWRCTNHSGFVYAWLSAHPIALRLEYGSELQREG